MNPQSQSNLQQAILAFQNRNFDGANLILKEILKNDINSNDIIFKLGIFFAKAEKLKEAMAVFACLQDYQRNDPRIPYNMGLIYAMREMHEYAINAYDRALQLKPDDVETLINKGASCIDIKNYALALEVLDQAILIKNELPEAWSNKALALKNLNFKKEAVLAYQHLISLNSNFDWAYGDLLAVQMSICDWNKLERNVDFIKEKVSEGKRAVRPFALLSLADEPILHKKSASIYIHSLYPENRNLGNFQRDPKNNRIRVGYFSADFRNHPISFLTAELYELHDQNRFEIFAFSFGANDLSEIRSRISQSFNRFIDVSNMPDIEIAQLSRSFNIDIAVDLNGFTKGARTGIFSYRAAPIQVNYLGYPGSLGADYIDYIIADKILILPELQLSYSEKVVYLPNSYQVNDRKRLVSEKQFTRQELGLPENGFVFSCFNNNFKILPVIFNSWMRILRAVDGSVLWLLKDNYLVVESLKNEAEKRGVAADRLVFAERLSMSEHLGRHRQADLFLDTFPYNAHTTTSDALWSGLPVLTMMGVSFASRVAASLLNAIGLPELITTNHAEYEALAIELATNSQKLADIKLKLANNRLTAPLFDTPLFTKNLESAYIEMYERYQADLEPEHINIT